MNKKIKQIYNILCMPYIGIPKTLWKGIFLTLIEATTSGFIFFFTLYFIYYLHFSISQSGALMSVYAMGTITGALVIGALAEKLPSKQLAALCLILKTIVFFLLTKLTSFNLIGVTLFLMGFSTYGFTTALNAWILADCCNQTDLEMKFINISRVAMNLGFGISGTLLTIVKIAHFKSIFYVAICLLLLGIFTVCTHVNRPTPSKLIKNTINADIPNQKTIYYLLIFCIFLVGLIIAQLGSTYPVFITNSYPLGSQGVGILFILDTFLVAFFQAPLIYYLKNTNKLALVGIGGFLMGLSFLILNIYPIFLLAIISCITWTIGEMIFIPTSQYVFYNNTRNNKPAQNLGIYQATSAIARVIGPSAGTFIYQHIGGHILWYICGIIGITCLVSCLNFRRLSTGMG